MEELFHISRGPVFAGAAALAAAALCACATLAPPPVDLAGPGWNVRQGQATWVPARGGAPLVGELLLAVKNDGALMVQFSKPPFTVASAQAAEGTWTVERPIERRRESGRGAPPGRVAWFALAGAFGARGIERGEWRFRRGGDGAWSLVHPGTGERLDGFLSP